jgi:hypothetical protein
MGFFRMEDSETFRNVSTRKRLASAQKHASLQEHLPPTGTGAKRATGLPGPKAAESEGDDSNWREF